MNLVIHTIADERSSVDLLEMNELLERKKRELLAAELDTSAPNGVTSGESVDRLLGGSQLYSRVRQLCDEPICVW